MDELLIIRFQDHMADLKLPNCLINYWMGRLYEGTLTELRLKFLLYSDTDDFQRDYDFSINY